MLDKISRFKASKANANGLLATLHCLWFQCFYGRPVEIDWTRDAVSELEAVFKELTFVQRRVLYADCASLAKHLLPEDVLRCRYWLVALTQKLILLQTGLDLCNTTVLPTRAVLNFVRRPYRVALLLWMRTTPSHMVNSRVGAMTICDYWSWYSLHLGSGLVGLSWRVLLSLTGVTKVGSVFPWGWQTTQLYIYMDYMDYNRPIYETTNVFFSTP